MGPSLPATGDHANRSFHASVLSSLHVGLRVSVFLAMVAAASALYYAPNAPTIGWAATACVVFLSIGRWASKLHDRLVAGEVELLDAERALLHMALITGLVWAAFPLCAWSATDTGWILNALALLAAMTTSSILYGLSTRSQLLVLLPIVTVTAPVFALASGNPGVAALTVLVAMVVPILLLGRLSRRIVMASVRSAAQAKTLNDELTDANALLAHSAHHDVLTGLPNRAGFAALVESAQQQAAAGESGYAIAFLDLDKFKQINDRYGHSVGDQVLLLVARRLDKSAQATDTVGRHGGDEFLCLFRDLESPEAALHAGSTLLRALDRPIELGDQRFAVAASLGVAYASGDEQLTIDELRVRADQALYEAKDRGRSRVRLFDNDLHLAITRRQETEKRLREALELGRITGWFQPVVDLETAKPCGVECLVRWLDDDMVQTPASFLGVAEEAQLGWPVTKSVLSSAAFLTRSLKQRDYALPIAVNVSPELVEAAIDHLIELTGVPDLNGVTFEITESRLIDDMPGLRRSLAEIRGLGGRVMLDDFGTGYSSLSLLAELPIDGVKIDCSFTSTIASSEISRTIVAAIVDIGRRTNLDVIAEGIETPDQMRALRDLGVRYAQGYLFSPAISADELETLVLEGHDFADVIERSEANTGDRRGQPPVR